MDQSSIFYIDILNRYSHKNNVPCINGKTIGSNKCCGYCMCDIHRGFLTKELRAQHDCLGKNCYYYIPKNVKPELTLFQLQLKSFRLEIGTV